MNTLAITGHTKGIGKALIELVKEEYNILGFSRSNGYNLKDDGIVQKIFQESKDADVFINNAFFRFAQIDLFNLFYNEWKTDSSKTILNIGSIARLKDDLGVGSYGYVKQEFHEAWRKIHREQDRKCKIYNISPGFVDTDMIASLNIPATTMLDADTAAKYIKWVLDTPKDIEIAELTFWKRDLSEESSNIPG